MTDHAERLARPLRVVQVAAQSGIGGGGNYAALRLHEGLIEQGIDSKMLVARHRGDRDPRITEVRGGLAGRVMRRLFTIADRAVVRRAASGREVRSWTYGIAAAPLGKWLSRLRPDVVNLHWINGGFLHPGALRKISCPTVWTMHDMWALTGGCHYSGSCAKYHERCGACPQLGSGDSNDLSARGWERKRRAWGDLHFTVVSPSSWLAACARASSLLHGTRVHVIPNGLDLDAFRPVDPAEAKRFLGLDPSVSYILFGALGADTDPRKGGDLLREALAGDAADLLRRQRVHLLVFGTASRSTSVDSDHGLVVERLGHLRTSEQLRHAYSAADAFVAPSREDNLPNTVAEATACGTPVAAFRIGGMPDLIEDGRTGRLAPPFDCEAFAGAVLDCLRLGRIEQVRDIVRQRAVGMLNLPRCAEQYAALYRQVASRRADSCKSP